MSTHTHTTPLWKQLLGACAGAAVAVIVYEAFLLVSPRLEAWVALPTAPGVENQAQTNLNVTGDIDARRQQARNREIAERFAASSSAISDAAWSAPSRIDPLHGAASSQASSATVSSAATTGGLKGVGEAAKAILGTAGSSSMSSWSAASSKASSSWSSQKAFVRPETPVVTKSMPSVPHGKSLPKSGVGVMMAAAAAFGASTERLRLRRKRRAESAA